MVSAAAGEGEELSHRLAVTGVSKGSSLEILRSAGSPKGVSTLLAPSLGEGGAADEGRRRTLWSMSAMCIKDCMLMRCEAIVAGAMPVPLSFGEGGEGRSGERP